ncbi:MAG: DUF4388 domain-containing protein [Myxococcota bacterium]|nr:DUF4388 domain-containing protein [Myxococcota bacterium]
MAKKLGERLVEAGLVTKEAVEQALQQQKITGYKIGDCLVELGLIAESVLLRFLAGELNTRYVSSDKLAKVKIPPEVMDKVPVRMAEAQRFIPIAIDPERKILSIVAAEPQNASLLDEIALVTGMDEVYAFIGLRSAIEAGIKKHYYGDPTAFASFDPSISQPSMRADIAARAAAYDASGSGSFRAPIPLRRETDPRARVRGTSMGNGTSIGASREGTAITRGSFADHDFGETLNVLVGMLEAQRPTLKGHSSQLARQAVLVGTRLSLPPRELAHLRVAAHLHHLGKPTERHFTLENNRLQTEWAQDARRYLKAPLKLFANVKLPSTVTTVLTQLYETWEGSGPLGIKGEEISIGARILAAVDAYLDLMKNPANAHGRVFSRQEALAVLSEGAGKLFDPVVVDLVGHIPSGELLREKLVADGRQILIADPDEGIRTDLLDATRKLGLVAHTQSTMEGVVDLALQGDADVVVVGLRYGVNDIVALTDALRRQPSTAAVPVVVLGETTETLARTQLYQAGISAVIPMPLDPDAAAKTLQQLFQERIDLGAPGRVVRGSYDELPQAELFRLIVQGKKSGRLLLKSEGAAEGFLQLEGGRVVHAAFSGETGPSAAKAMTRLQSAEFTYEPESLLMDVPTVDVELAALSPSA